MFISDKVDLRAKKITRDKESHYTIINGSIHLAILNVYTPNNRASKSMRQK